MRMLMGIPTGNDALPTLPDRPTSGGMVTLTSGDEMKIPDWSKSVGAAENKKYINDIAAKVLKNVNVRTVLSVCVCVASDEF